MPREEDRAFISLSIHARDRTPKEIRYEQRWEGMQRRSKLSILRRECLGLLLLPKQMCTFLSLSQAHRGLEYK